MKKTVSIALLVCFIITGISITLSNVRKTPFVSAIEFAEEIKKLDGKASQRLIVGSNRRINTMGAVDTAFGINGTYVLQYDSDRAARKAYNYYHSLSYIRYVEYDNDIDNGFCSTEGGYDFTPNCISTVNSNIDDAIKLIHKVKGDNLPEIRVAVIDSGIAKTAITRSRIDGGHTFLDNVNEDGTTIIPNNYNSQHGTHVAGTIILNTLGNVRLYSYQAVTNTGSMSLSYVLSSIYLAVENQCKVISMSVAFNKTYTDGSSCIEAVNYATEHGCICVAGAGNDSKPVIESTNYPALCENAITVGAVDSIKRLASFSNYGEGVDIYATGNSLTTYDSTGNETLWSGTSAATPVVSSICALLLEIQPDITVDEIKSLLLETGIATNEDEITETNRYVADAYECVKSLTGQELEKTDLQFEQAGSTITFHSDDENASVFYANNSGSLQIAYKDLFASNWYAASLGEEKTLRYYVITATAYAPGKAKSKIELLKAPIYNYEYGYLINEANDTQEYNIFSRCEIIDETVMVVPETINGIEVQEIGNYCYMGNQTVETIILPDTVKQIDAYAFANCPNLKNVIAPGVKNCGRYAFYDCPKLRYVSMPQVTLANTAMFRNCTSLSCLDIGELSTICNHAFKNCSVDLTDTDHHYEIVGYESVENDSIITLQCSKCGDEMQVSFMEHINTDYPLLDRNNDNIVNAKDIAMIINDV